MRIKHGKVPQKEMKFDWLKEQVEDHRQLVEALAGDEALLGTLEAMCDRVLACLKAGGRLLTCGNGGSASDALHLAEELIGRYAGDRRPYPATCLSADGPALTCIANDYGFEAIFERQVEALCGPGDLVVGFTTSGNSENVLRALRMAKQKGGVTLGMLGKDGGAARELCDVAFVVPSQNTARIQEFHALALHLLCEAVERELT